MLSNEERLKKYMPLFGKWIYGGNCLGYGGMSSGVYEVYCDESGRREYRALKMITLMTAYRSAEYSQAKKEVEIMRSLSGCANIVRYYESCLMKIYENNAVIGCDILILMEKLQPLNSELLRNERHVLKLGADICAALAFAHSNSIVHRDIKPQNILFDGSGTYKLGDFGIAKMLSSNTTSTAGFRSKPFVAPELWSGSTGDYDGTADIYSLGLILYYYLNGQKLPFVTDATLRQNVDAAIDRRLRGEPLPKPENGSADLLWIVKKACEFNPADRFRTAREMYDEIYSVAITGALTPKEQHCREEYFRAQSNIPGAAEPPKKPKKHIFIIAAIACVSALALIAGGVMLISDMLSGGEKETTSESAQAQMDESKAETNAQTSATSAATSSSAATVTETSTKPALTTGATTRTTSEYVDLGGYSAYVNLNTQAGSGDDLNIRSGPGYDYSVIQTIPNGSMVTVHASSGNWTLITCGSVRGWCQTSVARLVTVPNPMPLESSDVNSRGQINIRSGPGAGYGVVGSITDGEEVEVVAIINGWAHIVCSSTEGWCQINLS